MKQSTVDAVIRGLKKAGVSIVCYLPDSLVQAIDPASTPIRVSAPSRVTNEGEGAPLRRVFLSARRAALVMRIPAARIVELWHGWGWRRNPGGDADELSRRTGENNWVGDSHTASPWSRCWMRCGFRIRWAGGRQDRARHRRRLCLVLCLLLSLGSGARWRAGA